MKKLLFAYLLFPLVATSQNLIPNPGFELVKSDSCVKKAAIDMMPCVWNWYTVNGAPDYVNHRLNDQKYRAPQAKSGDAIVGLYMPHNNGLTLEYIEVELMETLQAGKRYYAEMYVAKDLKHYPKSIDGIGMFFSGKPFKDSIPERGLDQLKKILELDVQVISPRGNLLDKRKEWMLISGEFTANGNERFLCIGRFDFKGMKALEQAAYYYFDELSLVQLPDSNLSLAEKIERDKTVTLRNVLFESGSSALDQQSCYELNELVEFLYKNPQLKLRIEGHTDNQGSTDTNLELSTSRAKAVYNYIIHQGIAEDRLSYLGLGEQNPVTSNDSEEGRRINRRIEIILL